MHIASLRALAAIEPTVHAFQIDQRRLQMEMIAKLREAAKRPARSSAESLTLLLATERLADAIADGDPEALGVPARAMERALDEMLRVFLE